MKENPTNTYPGGASKNADGAGKPNKDTLTIIVGGVPTEVEVNLNAPLHTAVTKALEQSGNAGQPAERWLLRDGNGETLDLERKIGDYNFAADVKLFLSVKAGTGG